MDGLIQYLTYHRNNASEAMYICYSSSMTSTRGVWHGENPFTYSIPLFILQIILSVVITRIIDYLLRPLQMPRCVSEILAGIVVGPSAFGRSESFTLNLFPLRSLVIMDVFAHVGLIYYVFSIAVETDMKVIKYDVVRSFAFATACLIPPFAIGSIASFLVYPYNLDGVNQWSYTISIGVVLSVTTFSILVRTLAELKLVGTDVGRLTLSSAILNSSSMWILLVYSNALAASNGNYVMSFVTLLAGATFLILSLVLLRPAIQWILRRTPEGEEPDELYICILLVGVMLWALISDCIGTHAMYGAFVFGLAIPNGRLGHALIDKAEGFLVGLLMPFFFIISGLRTNVFKLNNFHCVAVLALASLVSAAAKVAGGVFMATLYKTPLQDGVSIGLLMNTKGVIELLILNIARTELVIGEQTFTVLVLMSIVIVVVVSPLLRTVAKPSRSLASYKRRTIQWSNPDSELRLLVCLHTPRQVSALIALLDVSNPTKRSPFFVYALHLIELAGRASAMLVVDYATPSSPSKDGQTFGGHNRLKAQSDHIFHAFESYEQHAGGVSVQFLTSISAYDTMHDDVVAAAEDKHAAIIILPFHKQQTVDGGMQVQHPALRVLNQNVLDSSPCSVGILVDRGLANHRSPRRVTLLFFGGPDDREGLALASRMAGHSEIKLRVIRFIHTPKSPSASSRSGSLSKNEREVSVILEEDREWPIDNKCIEEFKARWGRGIVEFEEMMMSNAEETITVIRQLEGTQDLLIVGKGQGVESPLTAGLKDWSECPELGPIGDMVASADFSLSTSVLVMQQGGGLTAAREGISTEVAPEVRMYLNKADYRTSHSIILGERIF